MESIMGVGILYRGTGVIVNRVLRYGRGTKET